MSFEFRDAKRENVPLLILLAGGTGSGKTESAMRLATGLSAGKPFAVIDTENGRALHKADDYTFKHAALEEPFSPERYAEAIRAADTAGYPVIVVDSGSHEYDGAGGVLELQIAEFERMGKRESARMASWIEPKRRHKAFVRQLLRVRAHVILCHRAEDKVELQKNSDGKLEVVPKRTITGLDGWVPICERRLPFEATISLLLTADAPGVPKPIKLERRHKDLVPLDEELSETTGVALAEWAHGDTKKQAEENRNAGTSGLAEEEPGPSPITAGSGLGDSAPEPSSSAQLATEAQRKLIFAKAKTAGIDEDKLREILAEHTGQTSTAQIPKAKVNDVLAAIAA